MRALQSVSCKHYPRCIRPERSAGQPRRRCRFRCRRRIL